MIEKLDFSSRDPSLSIVIPAFNQEKLIARTLDSLTQALTLPAELIVINDSSEDKTLDAILGWCRSLHKTSDSKYASVSVYGTRRQVFETACDNFGFRQSKSDFILELQADILISENGFDARMIEALRLRDDILALSGRGVESFESAFSLMGRKGGTTVSRGITPRRHLWNTLLTPARRFLDLVVGLFKTNAPLDGGREIMPPFQPFPDGSQFQVSRQAGKLSAEPFHSHPRNQIWLGESIMRGPIMFNRGLLAELDYLDQDAYFLGYDDHDLCLRAAKKGYLVGFLPVGFQSDPIWGSSRRRRTLRSEISLARERFRVAKNWRLSDSFSTSISGAYPPVRSQIIKLEGGIFAATE